MLWDHFCIKFRNGRALKWLLIMYCTFKKVLENSSIFEQCSLKLFYNVICQGIFFNLQHNALTYPQIITSIMQKYQAVILLIVEKFEQNIITHVKKEYKLSKMMRVWICLIIRSLNINKYIYFRAKRKNIQLLNF